MNYKYMLFCIYLFCSVCLASGCRTYTAKVETLVPQVKNFRQIKFYVNKVMFNDKVSSSQDVLKKALIEKYPHLFAKEQVDAVPISFFVNLTHTEPSPLINAWRVGKRIVSFCSLGIIPIQDSWKEYYSITAYAGQLKGKVSLQVRYQHMVGGLFIHGLVLDLKNADWYGTPPRGSAAAIMLNEPAFLNFFIAALCAIDENNLLSLYQEKYEEQVELLKE